MYRDPLIISETPEARDPVEELAELFLERYRRGERPSLSEFTAQAPDHADEILDLFPALVLMEQAHVAPLRSSRDSLGTGTLERIGDYRILREVGRGGMGIVFEAEQETLGRRVALKVLPGPSSASALLRFRREARSAARLHHTNIVPVFDVGERDGVHYYAMQFIQGQGLDEVIADLRLLRRPLDSIVPDCESVGRAAMECDSRATTKTSGGQTDERVEALSSTSQGAMSFYKRVAHIGLQAAEALAYAHGQRVYHRDIKPANLLFDTCGTVWVTDFGLAKDEGEDLTRTGSVVGTLRYMAPERFRGISDAFSDVYGLGVTLYELLALRPAFAESDRAQLVRAIMQAEPRAPRKIDRSIPRDLETIVLKSIAKEPSHRYASAEHLAADLRRFIADMPLLARRAPPWERIGRWCRRNPGWAATLAAAISLLLVVALGGTLLSLHLRTAVNDLQASRKLETTRLWQAHLERARALRSSNRVGQRYLALASLREAAKIKVTRELRDEAVAALVLPDVEVAQEWVGCPPGTVYMAHDAALKTYVRVNEQGEMTLCQVTPRGEKILATEQTDKPTHLHLLRMSRDGRCVVFVRQATDSLAGSIEIWKCDVRGMTKYATLVEPLGYTSIDFDAASRRLAIGHHDGTVAIVDVNANDSHTTTLNVGAAPLTIAFSPDGHQLAAACGTSIRVLEIDTGRLIAELVAASVGSWQYGLCWRPDGKVLGAAGDATTIHLWEIATSSEIVTPLEGHTAPGILLTFNQSGDRIISNGWDGQTRLWDAVTGQLLLVMPGKVGEVFGPDDTTVGIGRDGELLRIWRLADGRELRRLRRPLAGPKETLHSPVLQVDGPVVAAASNKGLAFFDIENGHELGFALFDNLTVAYPRGYDPASGWLTGGWMAAAVWPAQRDRNHPELLRIGPPETLARSVDAGLDMSADGRVRVIPCRDHALVLDRNKRDWWAELRPHTDIRNCAISPDGRLAVTFSWHTDGQYSPVRVWDLPSGKHVVDLPIKGGAVGRFSPNGRWLATYSTEPSAQLWDVATWQPIRSLPDGPSCWITPGDLLASRAGLGQISIAEPVTGNEILRLTGPLSQIHIPAFVTPDGARLVAGVADGSSLFIWDMLLIGQQVREMGLEWDWPIRPASTPLSELPPVRRVVIDLGDWLAPEKSGSGI